LLKTRGDDLNDGVRGTWIFGRDSFRFHAATHRHHSRHHPGAGTPSRLIRLHPWPVPATREVEIVALFFLCSLSFVSHFLFLLILLERFQLAGSVGDAPSAAHSAAWISAANRVGPVLNRCASALGGYPRHFDSLCNAPGGMYHALGGLWPVAIEQGPHEQEDRRYREETMKQIDGAER
jgi:hypothetical protein